MDIVVLAGGLSPERDVSLSSGSLIANALMQNGHRVLLVDLYLGAAHTSFSAAHRALGVQSYHYAVPDTEPDLAALQAQHGHSGPIGPGVLALCKSAHVTFLALHGSIGENGRLQAVLEVNGVRYTGTGCEGSMLAMDKALAKQLLRAQGIPTPGWVQVNAGAPPAQPPFLPCAVKPVGCGSSIGVSLVHSAAQFHSAIQAAARYEATVLVEHLVEGREFSVGILDGRALPVIEIVPQKGFYTYQSKYQPGLAQEQCPASLPAAQARALQQAALAAHHTLRLGGYSRVDFMQDKQGGIWCLEANTLPGMTPTSLLPQEALAAGISYPQLCQRIVQLAL